MPRNSFTRRPAMLLVLPALLAACQSQPVQQQTAAPEAAAPAAKVDSTGKKYLAQPLVRGIYTA